MNRTVFVDVDTQWDFCDPKGALCVPGSPNEVFGELIEYALSKAIPIVGSVDSHAYDAWEFGSNDNVGPEGEKPGFADHCVKGTAGWLKMPGTLPDRFRFVSPVLPPRPAEEANALASELLSGANQALYFEKEVYSLFANPLAEAVVEALDAAVGGARFVVFGVATEYCVQAAALGLADRGYEVVLLNDAVAGIVAADAELALETMKEKGVEVVNRHML